ncbi:MAG: hypothetical protein U0932_07120 [Thiobacillus sp.]|nr:hypothetical protein [Thiobacillus sp.]
MTADTPKNVAPQPEQVKTAETDEYYNKLQALKDRCRGLDWQEVRDAQQAELGQWQRDKKMALLQTMLKPGTEITIQPTDRWLDTLLLYNPGVLAEAQRLKGRMSEMPWHAKRAAAEGDMYWLRLAGSYGGN